MNVSICAKHYLLFGGGGLCYSRSSMISNAMSNHLRLAMSFWFILSQMLSMFPSVLRVLSGRAVRLYGSDMIQYGYAKLRSPQCTVCDKGEIVDMATPPHDPCSAQLIVPDTKVIRLGQIK
jgi:hypothetical protein